MDHGIKTLRQQMSTTHEVADIVIPQQVISAIEEGVTFVKVIIDYIYVSALLLQSHIEQPLITTVFLEGIGSNINVIGIEKTADKQKDVEPSSLAAHALSGCDTVSNLYRLGKKSVCSLL